ncbi:MAG: hypothetical protein ACE5JO_02550 [Candidatus Binatia bacterium]
MKERSRETTEAMLAAFFFVLAFFGDAAAQVPSAARREAVRLERLANNVLEGMFEDVRFGRSWGQRTLLDVFNFTNGARYLSERLERGRTQSKELSEIVELLLLQSQAVDRSLRSGRAGRGLLRDWEETRASLDSLAHLFTPSQEPFTGRREIPHAQENVNKLSIEIKEIRHVGNIFKNDYRIHGVISGRNIVSAGIYYKGRLLKALSVRLHDRRFTENPFRVRMEDPGGDVTLRVIDNRGFVLEQPVEFPEGGLFPGFK